jgi:hypothetical protein
MTWYEARTKAESEYKQAVRELKQNDSQRNRDRVKIKLALLDGLKKWYGRTG